MIVALQTQDSVDILDEWLLRFEKSLKPFNDNEKFVAVYAESISEWSVNNYLLIKTIGKGQTSKVILGRKKDTGILYALKIFDKNETLADSKSHVFNEKNTLSKLSHPFIIKLYWAFQSVFFI